MNSRSVHLVIYSQVSSFLYFYVCGRWWGGVYYCLIFCGGGRHSSRLFVSSSVCLWICMSVSPPLPPPHTHTQTLPLSFFLFLSLPSVKPPVRLSQIPCQNENNGPYQNEDNRPYQNGNSRMSQTCRRTQVATDTAPGHPSDSPCSRSETKDTIIQLQ